VTYYVREQKRHTKEVFVPLSHSDAVFMKGYPAETTEAFCDGHVSAFAFFGGIYYPAGDCVAICREGPSPSLRQYQDRCCAYSGGQNARPDS